MTVVVVVAPLLVYSVAPVVPVDGVADLVPQVVPEAALASLAAHHALVPSHASVASPAGALVA